LVPIFLELVIPLRLEGAAHVNELAMQDRSMNGGCAERESKCSTTACSTTGCATEMNLTDERNQSKLA
jgi:hypothetical protein